MIAKADVVEGGIPPGAYNTELVWRECETLKAHREAGCERIFHGLVSRVVIRRVCVMAGGLSILYVVRWFSLLLVSYDRFLLFLLCVRIAG